MASVQLAPQSQTSTQFSRSHVSAHNVPTDLWVIIGNEIYNVTKFQNDHPGGVKGKTLFVLSNSCLRLLTLAIVLQNVAGQDATKKFFKHHNPKLLERYKDELKIGEVIEDGEAKGATGIEKLKLKFFKRKS